MPAEYLYLSSLVRHSGKFTDNLGSDVKKLESDGSNWAIFLARFSEAVQAKGRWGHFTGTSTRPDDTLPLPAGRQAELDKWDTDEAIAKQMLTSRVPDSTVIKLQKYATVALRWAAVVAEYSTKGDYAAANLRERFMASKCGEKESVRKFLDALATKREELAAVGVAISENDYRSTIINSIPRALSAFASSMLAGFRLQQQNTQQQLAQAARAMGMTLPPATATEIPPDFLISVICEEYDRRIADRGRRSASTPGAVDEALAVTPGRSGKPKKSKPRSDKVCWNCEKPGHFKRNCPEPPKSGSAAAAKGGSSGNANAVIEECDSDIGGAFALEETSDDDASQAASSDVPSLIPLSDSDASRAASDCDDADMPDLVSVSSTTESGVVEEAEVDSIGDDWHSEIGDDASCACDSGEWPDTDWSMLSSDCESGSDGSGVLVDAVTPEPAAIAAAVTAAHGHEDGHGVRTELYDSGTTSHISPYRDDFENRRLGTRWCPSASSTRRASRPSSVTASVASLPRTARRSARCSAAPRVSTASTAKGILRMRRCSRSPQRRCIGSSGTARPTSRVAC